MRTALVSIPTDTVPLDGAWHEPDEGRAANAVLLFHGNTMNFYQGAPRFLPPALTRMGYACLAFNRRGHDILGIRDSRVAEGAAFQTYAQAIEDNRIAARWLAARGYSSPVVIGHSNGGTLAVRHVAEHRATPALVLLSAHCGGRDMVARASAAGLLAQDRLEHFVQLSKTLVSEGRGRELMLLPGWWYATSAASFVDAMEHCPDVLELAPRIACPVLYLRGEREPRELYPAEAFAQRCAGVCTVSIVADCDHFYAGREAAVTRLVSDWLAQTVDMPRRASFQSGYEEEA
jgi:pimeloyl-ACP methyl ester carboxylesterase